MSKHLLKLQNCKLVLLSAFSFIVGCMLTISLLPIDRTCKIEDTDREFNIMNDSKLRSPKLIVLILSAPDNSNKRNTIRNTWLKLKNRGHAMEEANFKHFFAVGGLGLESDKVRLINSEQRQFNDILILPMQDSYGNLTRKVLKSFEWLQGQFEFGVDFKYVLKCDDDSFVRIDNFLHEIAQLELMFLKGEVQTDNVSPYLTVNVQTNDERLIKSNLNLYWGYFNGNAKIKTSGKWKETDWILCDTYLPYALGGGYVLSKNLVTFIAQNGEYLRLYKSEDISVGVWLSSVKNILRIHDRRFDTEWTSRGCHNDHLIIHNISEKKMREFYRNVIETNKLCDKEEVRRAYYMYNWTVSPSKCCTAV